LPEKNNFEACAFFEFLIPGRAKGKSCLHFILLFLFILKWQMLVAQNQAGFLNVKITTNSNTYGGPLRKGKEEMY
jgi:hypothetical protein